MAQPNDEVERRIEEARAALERGDRLAAEAALLAAIHAPENADTSPVVRAEALMLLGSLQLDEGRLDEAERLLREGLAALTDGVPGNAALRASTLAALGQVLVEGGDADGARAALTEALLLRETDSRSNDADLVLLLNELSRLCLKQGAYAEAEPLLRRMLAVKRLKGMAHPEVATVLTSLATVRQAVGDLDLAEQLHREALGIREQALAPQHFSIAATLEHLADVSAARGKLSDAVSFYQRALVIRELTVGSGHPSVQSARERIADLQLQATDTVADGVRRPAASVSPGGERPPAPRITPPPHERIRAQPSAKEPVVLLPWANQLTALERELGPTSREAPTRVAVAFGEAPGSRVRRATTIAGICATLALLVGAGFWINWRYQHKPTRPSVVKLESTDAPVRVPQDSAIGRSTAGSLPSHRLTVDPGTLEALPVPDSTRGAPGTLPAGTPRLLGTAPPPKYPRRLRKSGVQGDVLVQFVVDEQGHPAMASFTVLHSPHRLLTNAVRDAVARLQFEPARTPPPTLTPKADTVNYAFSFHARAK